MLAVVGSGPGSVGGLVADSPGPNSRTHGNTVCRIFHPPPLSNLAVVNVQRLVSRPRHAVTCCPRAHVLPSSARRLLLPLLITACLCHPSDLIFFYGVVQTTYVCLLPPLQNRLDVLRRRVCVLTPKLPPKPADIHTSTSTSLGLPHTSPMQNTDQPASSRVHQLTPMSSSTDVFDDTSSSSSSRRAAQ